MKHNVKILLSFCLSVFCSACGDSQTLPETGNTHPSNQNVSADQRGQRSASGDQVILTGSDTSVQGRPAAGPQTFEDANRFGEVGKKSPLGDVVSAAEEMTPKLASGTLLEEWRNGKLPTTKGQPECANHPKKIECESKATVFTRGGSFGVNQCKCQ